MTYVTADEFRAYLGDPSGSIDESAYLSAIKAASKRIDTLCGRYFTQDSTVSAKYFNPESPYELCLVDCEGQRWDLSTTTGLIVETDTAYTGAYGTTLTLNTHFFLEPLNGAKYGQTGWPYEELQILQGSSATFPAAAHGYRPTVKITGKWGWAAVPDGVTQACFELAKYYFKNRDVSGGFVGFDAGVVRSRPPSAVMDLLEPFIPASRLVA